VVRAPKAGRDGRAGRVQGPGGLTRPLADRGGAPKRGGSRGVGTAQVSGESGLPGSRAGRGSG